MVSVLGSTADASYALVHIDAEVSSRRVSQLFARLFYSLPAHPPCFGKVAEETADFFGRLFGDYGMGMGAMPGGMMGGMGTMMGGYGMNMGMPWGY